MKHTFRIICFFSICIACNGVERGAADNDTLSRKVFDTVRHNDFDKLEMLMPDKGTFRKIQELNGIVVEDVNKAYDDFILQAENSFTTARANYNNWESCKYLNTTTEEVKTGAQPSALVTIKFNGEGGPYKMTVTSVKFNNRWYVMGDLNWVVKVM